MSVCLIGLASVFQGVHRRVGRAPHSRFSQMAKAAAQAAAKELLERVLKEGIVIPGDEKQQHMRMGQVSVGVLRKVSTL